MLRLFAALTLFAGLLGALVVTGRHAYACSLAGFESDEQRLEDQISSSELVVVGLVSDEVVVGSVGGRPGRPTFQSTLQVVAVLAGSPGTGTLEISPLGWLSSARTGGPRLLEGERVMLFLAPPANPFDFEENVDYTRWQIVLAGQGKYFFLDGRAFFETGYNFEYGREPDRAGKAADFIRSVATTVDAPPDQIEVAVAFAEGGAVEPLEQEDPALPPASEAAPAPRSIDAPVEPVASESASPAVTDLPGEGSSGGSDAWWIALVAVASVLGAAVLTRYRFVRR